MKKEQGYDYLMKLLVVGDSGVGKTNMLLRFCQNNFLNSHLTTIGIDFKTKTLNMDGKKVRMQIWDTAGQERFKTITQTYYRGAMGIVITYAVDDKQSFQHMENWFKQIKTHATEGVVKILVGNKSDSPRREVSFEEGQSLANKLNIPFFETSAKENSNIEGCFMLMAQQVKKKMASDEIGSSIYTGSKIYRKLEDKPHKGKCC